MGAGRTAARFLVGSGWVRIVSVTTQVVWEPDGELDGVRLEAPQVGGVRADGMRLMDVVITSGTFTGSELEGSAWRDCLLSTVRLVGVRAARSRWDGTGVEECSLAGCDLSATAWRRVRLIGCVLDGVNLRRSTWQDVELVDCRLRDVDLGGARLSAVRMERCTLDEVDLTQAQLTGVDLRGSHLRLARGWEQLRGAVIDHVQLADIAPALATAWGIRVED